MRFWYLSHIRVAKALAPRLKICFHAQLSRKFQLLINTKILTKIFLALSLLDVVFIMLINVKMRWHYNIYEQDKFRAQLS